MNSNVPGWTIKTDEISAGVLKVTLTDIDGRKAEVVDSATETTINLAKDYAFEIEKQIRKPWHQFLLDFIKLNLADQPITVKDKLGFGSWIVELKDKRFIYDGRDFWLIYQTKESGQWADNSIIKDKDLKYTNLNDLLNKFKT